MIHSRRPAHRAQFTHNRSGLTWVELLIVLGIIVLVVTFLAPATLTERTVSRRSQCKNNLKQMGLARHNYHDVDQSFPPGYIIDQQGPYLGWSWGMFISPYCDFNPSVNYSAGLPGNVGSLNSSYFRPMFICPSDSGEASLEHALIVTSDVVKEPRQPGQFWKFVFRQTSLLRSLELSGNVWTKQRYDASTDQ